MYVWVALGSASGGMLRYAISRAMGGGTPAFPWSTLLINVLGSFLIGYFGTLTVPGSRFAVPESARVLVMVGVCGGFTTFSSFSLQTFDLLRAGAVGRALANVCLSILLCLISVSLGHYLAAATSGSRQVAITRDEEFSG